MSMSNSFETDILELIFNNTNIANIGDVAGLQGSSTAGSFYVRLYTSAVAVDDATIGTEAAYTGYVTGGVAVARSGAGWTVAGNNAQNAAEIAFAECTAGSETIRYFAIWKDNSSSNDAERVVWGQLTSDLAVSANVTPKFPAGTLNINAQ